MITFPRHRYEISDEEDVLPVPQLATSRTSFNDKLGDDGGYTTDQYYEPVLRGISSENGIDDQHDLSNSASLAATEETQAIHLVDNETVRHGGKFYTMF